tara:strand:+ start:444 stop:635 length:192 start_codon:yes stop_codon:yes gene_type:complete
MDSKKCPGNYSGGEKATTHNWIWMRRISGRMCQYCDMNMDRQGKLWRSGEILIETENDSKKHI